MRWEGARLGAWPCRLWVLVVQKRFGGCIDAPSATSRCVVILSVFGRFLSGDTSDQDFSRPGAGLQQQTHAFRQRLGPHRGYQRFGADDVHDTRHIVGQHVQRHLGGNGKNPMLNGRRQPSCGGTSRMTRECQVRFCERLGVKLPRPTRQSRPYGNVRSWGAKRTSKIP